MADNTEKTYEYARRAFLHFLGSEPESLTIMSVGHINESFLAKGNGRYICQHMNAGLYGKRLKVLQTNYLAYVRAFYSVRDDVGNWQVPVWVRDEKGEYFYTDANGGFWRVYRYIDGYTKEKGNDIQDAYALGRALALIHHVMSAIGDRLEPGTPGIYDLKHHYNRYCQIKNAASSRDDICDSIIRERAAYYLEMELPKNEVIHGDAKLQNALFSDGEVISFIDLDTIMPGSRLVEIADSIRSCCMEDDRLVINRFDAFLQGYEDTGFFSISVNDREMIPLLVHAVCFELGLRYYNDSLSGEGYFREVCPGQNADKARRLLLFSNLV